MPPVLSHSVFVENAPAYQGLSDRNLPISLRFHCLVGLDSLDMLVALQRVDSILIEGNPSLILRSAYGPEGSNVHMQIPGLTRNP